MADQPSYWSASPFVYKGPVSRYATWQAKLEEPRLNTVSIFDMAAETKFDGTDFSTYKFSEPVGFHIIFCGFMGHESEYFQYQQRSQKCSHVL